MDKVRTWLKRQGLGEYAEAFERNRIEFSILEDLSDQDLRDLGVQALGHRKVLLRAIEQLKAAGDSPSTTPASTVPSTSAPVHTAERRQLTILFCDLVGSTALSQHLDPEALRELMQHYLQVCRDVIEKYEGHVAQYLGDGLMVYFGFPRAHEDDAERAVRSALEIVLAVKKVAAPSPLCVRLGVATGPVVVGETGAGDASIPKLAVGETPNLAARLQALAGADELIIAPSTHRLLGSAFAFMDLGKQTLKGILEPVNAYRVTGESVAEGRFEATRAHALTSFVGREEEIALLKQRWEHAREGEGQVVLLSGEAGIGKSRAIVESDAVKETDTEFVLTRPLTSLSIPSTLQDSLMARLDRLPSAKEVAQIGACIGREFGHDLLAAACAQSESALGRAVEELLKPGLVSRTGSSPHTSYIFKHALVQDVAYQSMLKSSRAKVYTLIARAIEDTQPAVREANPETLAHHATEAGLSDQAVELWQRAARNAIGRSALEEGAAHA